MTVVVTPILVSAKDVEFQQVVRGMIVADNVRVRVEPNIKSKIQTKLEWGEQVRIFSINNDWAKVCTIGFGQYACGWVYSAYFDPCHEHFKIINPYIRKGILKYRTCVRPTDIEKEEIKNFIKEFGTACEQKDYEHFKRHTTESIYFNGSVCPEPYYEVLPVSKYSYEHQKIDCFGFSSSYQSCMDLPRSSHCDINEVSDYLDKNEFIVKQNGSENMSQSDENYYKNGNCAVTFGNNWMNVWIYHNIEDLFCGTFEAYYFRKINSIWKLTRKDIFGPC